MSNSWIILALLAALAAATVVVLTKAGLKNIDSSLAFAIQSVLILIISWTVVITQGHLKGLQALDRKAWIFLLIAGVATTLSTLLSYKALKIGKASYVTSLERLSLVFAILFSVLFLKEKFSWQLVAGAAIMIGGAVVIAMAEESS